VEAYLSGEKSFVKPDLSLMRLIADSVVSLLLIRTYLYGKYFAGYAFLPHHLKWSFNFLAKVHFERHRPLTPGDYAHAMVCKTQKLSCPVLA